MKICTKCHESKPEDEFYRLRRNGSDQPYSHCKECHKALVRDWQRRNSARWMELHTDYNRKRRLTHPDQRQAYESVQRHLPPARTQTCTVCGQPAEHYHHHNGYAPEHKLDVVPVCRQCHAEIHRQ